MYDLRCLFTALAIIPALVNLSAAQESEKDEVRLERRVGAIVLQSHRKLFGGSDRDRECLAAQVESLAKRLETDSAFGEVLRNAGISEITLLKPEPALGWSGEWVLPEGGFAYLGVTAGADCGEAQRPPVPAPPAPGFMLHQQIQWRLASEPDSAYQEWLHNPPSPGGAIPPWALYSNYPVRAESILIYGARPMGSELHTLLVLESSDFPLGLAWKLEKETPIVLRPGKPWLIERTIGEKVFRIRLELRNRDP